MHEKSTIEKSKLLELIIEIILFNGGLIIKQMVFPM